MDTVQMRVAAAALLLVLVVLSGLWVRRSGKPYATVPFTIHKLVGLAAGVIMAAIVYQAHQVAPLGTLEIAFVAVTVILFSTTVATGGLLSVEKPMPELVSRLHLILPAVALLSTAGTLYFLLCNR